MEIELKNSSQINNKQNQLSQLKKFQLGGPMSLSSYLDLSGGKGKKAIDEGTKKLATAFNTAMGWLGEMLTGPLSGMAVPAGTTSGAWSYSRSPHYARNATTLQPAAKKLIDENAVYVSPSSHIAAWTQGSLDPKKGAEVLASDPRLQSLGIIGDLATLKYGPKVIKATPKVVKGVSKAAVDAAAKAGNKTAKAAVVAREINKATKNKPNLSNRTISVKRSNNIITKQPDLVYTLYNEFGEPIGQTNVGGAVFGSGNKTHRMVDGVMSMRNAHKVSEDTYNAAIQDIVDNGGKGLESGWSLMMPQKTLAVTSKFPHTIIGQEFGNPVRLLTGTSSRAVPQRVSGNHFLEIKPSTEIKYNEITGDFEQVPIANSEPYVPTSLKFFERRPSRISLAERLGIPKGERFVRPFRVANYPGYQLKGLMKGSQLEKQLSKNGTININQLNAYFNKASQIEKEVANKVLAEKFAGQKTIDYNQFKKAVQDELIGNYNRNYNAQSMIPTMTTGKMMAYGGDRLGIIKDFKDIPDGTGGLVTTWTNELPVLFKQFTFETPKISIGNRKHYSGQPIGHTRTFTNQQEPQILHVMESQSDWAQKSLGLTKAEKTAIQNIDEQLKTGTPTGFSTLEELQAQKQAILDRASQRTQGISYQSQYLHDNYLQRQLQENLRYAAENGQTKMRYPTSETAAKIEGYQKVNHTQLNELSEQQMKLGEQFENGEISWEEYDKMMDTINKQKKELFGKEYDPKHQTILKKYADFPKLFQKLYKDQKVRTVTDTKGNTWYEVDVPKNYLNLEWQFKQGGILNFLK